MNTITKSFFVLFICFSTAYLAAQNNRLFYQTESGVLPSNYNFTVAERNGVPYFFAVKESDGSFMKLAYGPIDESTLSPISYHYITLPVEKDHFRFLNGVNIVGDRLDLVLQSGVAATATKLEFIEIDLSSNTILNTSSTQEIYHRGFFRARSINQKLIVYGIIPSSNTLVRLEKEVTGSYLTDTVQGTFGSFVVAARTTELEVVNDTEYLAVITGPSDVSFVKRNADNSYIIASAPAVGNSARSWDFIPYQNNTLLFIGASNTVELDYDLSVVNQISGNFLEYSGGFPPTKTLFKDGIINIYSSAGPKGKFTQLNTSFDTIGQYDFDRKVIPFDVISINNNNWMIGVTTDEAGSSNTSVKSSLIINQNLDTSPIEEHHRVLGINNFKFNVGNYSRLFPHYVSGTASLTYGDGVNDPGVIFETSDNIIGKNENDELVGIWGRFTLGNVLFPGPLFTSTADTNLQKDKYNRSYYVTAQMISDHVGHILTYGNPDYGMPNGIKYWPGNGNTANGEAHKIAEFVDHNGNGIYEPHLGEFPKIYGDKCLLAVYHQDANDGLGNDLEVHRYLFAYDCDTNEVLKNTLFCNVKYINRGGDLHDIYAGSYIDYDIGYSADDYVGTHVGLGMVYGYNGDPFDETNGSQIGFQDSIPAMGQLLLSGVKLEDDGEDNAVGVGPGESINGVGFGDGIIDNEHYTLESSYYMTNAGAFPHSDGANPVQFYYNLQGLASDGSALFSGITSPYSLIGQSDPDFYATGGTPHANDFSEFSIGNSPGDRRILSGSGPGALLSGDTLNYLTAYILSFGELNDPQGPSVGQLFTDAAKIKSYFANNDLGCGKTFGISDESLNVKTPKQLDFTIYPNPFKDELFIRHEFTGNVQLKIRNLNGQEVYQEANISAQQQISVELTSGIYFVELTSSKGTVIKKLIRK